MSNIFSETDRNKSKPQHDTSDQARSRRLASHWKKEIELTEKKLNNWVKRAEDIQRRFRDDRNKSTEEGQRRLNTLWGWYETIKPACYSKVPNAVVERRFLDRDPTGRMSAQILERSLNSELKINCFHQAMERVISDYLLPGRGQLWVRYEKDYGESDSISPTTYIDMDDSQGEIEPRDNSEEAEKLKDTNLELIMESTQIDYVPWKDFGYIPADARTFPEVQAVYKIVYLSKDECIEKFGEKVGNTIQSEGLEPRTKLYKDEVLDPQDKKDQKRRIYEIWDKATRKVYWVSHGYEYLCDELDDPLELTGFFPCPEPLSAIMTTDTFVPIPFYHEFQDQALQIDELTQRINMLTKSLKACGVYDASAKAFARLLNENTENALIPVENWSGLGEKGLESAVFFMPIKEVAEVLMHLIEVRKQVMEDLDLITGISDIQRGTSDARETMGAQRLKANAAGTRVEAMRTNVGRFTTDVVNIVGEIIAKHFDDKTLIETSGILYEEGIPNNLGQSVLAMGGLPGLPSPPTQPLQLPPPSPSAGPPMPPGQPPGASAPVGAGIAGGNAPGPMTNTQQGGPPMPMAGQLSLQGASQPPMQPSPMAGLMPVFQAIQKVMKSIDLLRQDIPRGFRIDVEIDSMVSGDHQVERQDAVELIQATAQFMEKAIPAIQQQPLLAPLLCKELQFMFRKFRVGRDMEQTLDELCDQLTKMAQQPKPQQPNPEQLKAQTEQARSQAEIAKAKLDAQSQQANDQREQQLAQQDAQIKMMEMQMQLKKMEREEAFAVAEHQRKMAELELAHQHKLQQHALNQPVMPQPLNPVSSVQ